MNTSNYIITNSEVSKRMTNQFYSINNYITIEYNQTDALIQPTNGTNRTVGQSQIKWNFNSSFVTTAINVNTTQMSLMNTIIQK